MPAVSTALATFLFTNIEDGRQYYDADSDEARLAIAQYDRIVTETISTERGHVFKKGLGTFKAVFDDPDRAVSAALKISVALRATSRPAAANALTDRTRTALHSGIPDRYENIYSGAAVRRCGALVEAAHGGQILLSDETCALLCEALPPGASLLDLGIHGLDDARSPIRIWQVSHPSCPDQFPPLNTRDLSATNIAVQSRPFIGRKGEIARVRSLLRYHRLVTLTGEAGIGKTSLAYEIGLSESGVHEDGTWHIALDEVCNNLELAGELAGAVGVRQDPGGSLTDALIAFLQDKCILLILDGCDRIRTECAELVSELLLHCPSLTVLATGTTPLGCDAEHPYSVPPLSRPPATPDTPEPAPTYVLVRYEAVRLFLERVRIHQPEYELTPESAAALCRLIDHVAGNPLAIELTSAQADSMPLDEITKEITAVRSTFHDRRGSAGKADPPCTLDEVVDWTFARLGLQEKLLLLRASVFSGGWELAEAEAICSDTPHREIRTAETRISPAEVAGVLESLVRSGLVDRVDCGPAPRFSLPRPVLTYCRARRRQMREDAWLRARHCSYFHRLALEAACIEDFLQRTAVIERLDRSRHNLRAALAEAMDQTALPGSDGAVERLLSFAAAATPFWTARGCYSEGRRYLSRALECPGGSNSGSPRADALLAAGRLALREGMESNAATLIEGALAIYNTLSDCPGAAECLVLLADSLPEHARPPMAANGRNGKSSAVGRTEHVSRSGAPGIDGGSALRYGRHAIGTVRGADVISIRRQASHDRTTAAALETIGRSALDRGDLQASLESFRRSVALWRKLRDNRRIASILESMAVLACLEKRSDSAATLYVAARYLQKEDDVLLSAQGWAERGEADAWIRSRVDSSALTELEQRNGSFQIDTVISNICDAEAHSVEGGKPAASDVPSA